MSCRGISCVREEVCIGCNAESSVFKAYVSIIYRKSCTYAGFLKETRIHIKKYHFKGTSRHFQTLVSSEKF